jgi:hypothetical protein
MRRLLSLLLSACAIIACTSSVTLSPPVTCPSVTVNNVNGECDLVVSGQCSDGNFYEINCGDDSTCTCIINGNLDGSPILVSDQSFGFCAGLTASMFHDLASKFPDPSHDGDNLNLVSN